MRSDANVLAKVIALYVAKNSRGASPKYLLGESYGGFRAAKVAGALQSDQGIVVTGIVMVSPLLEASFQWGGSQYALGAALHFPTLVATELERTKKFTPEALAEAERFAMNEYLTTLAGRPPTGDKAKAFYGRIAEMTGLPVDVVAKSRGWVRNAYLQHLRANGQTVSSYDATFAVPDPYPESARRGGGDPILDGFTRALSGAFVGYARDELGFKTDMTYTLLAHDVSSKWEWGDRREPPGVSDDLRELLALSPSFRLLVAHGRTDLVTPYGVSRYVLDHIPDIGGAGPRAAQALPRRPHVLFRRGFPPRLRRRREKLLSGRALRPAVRPIEFHQGGNRFPARFVESRCHFVTASGECHGSASQLEGLSEAFAGFVLGCALFRDLHEPARPLQHHQQEDRQSRPQPGGRRRDRGAGRAGGPRQGLPDREGPVRAGRGRGARRGGAGEHAHHRHRNLRAAQRSGRNLSR